MSYERKENANCTYSSSLLLGVTPTLATSLPLCTKRQVLNPYGEIRVTVQVGSALPRQRCWSWWCCVSCVRGGDRGVAWLAGVVEEEEDFVEPLDNSEVTRTSYSQERNQPADAMGHVGGEMY